MNNGIRTLDAFLPLRVRTEGLCGTDERDLCTIEGRERPHGATATDPELRRSGLTIRDKVAQVTPGLPDAPGVAAELVRRANLHNDLMQALDAMVKMIDGAVAARVNGSISATCITMERAREVLRRG